MLHRVIVPTLVGIMLELQVPMRSIENVILGESRIRSIPSTPSRGRST